MKKLFLAIALTVLAVATSCKKEDNPTVVIPEGALSGVFTVDASGTKVHFSKGNLYFTGSTFQFEANQYDFRHYNGKTGDTAVISGGDNGEWRYLLTKRTVNGGTGEGKSYLRAKIRSDISGGIFGMIIYPDNYTSQTTAESYTSSEWTTMENAGCVFIPAAGYRDDTVIGQVNDYGRYLSSTASGAGKSYYLRFCIDDIVFSYDYSNDYGRSVRLVTAAQ